MEITDISVRTWNRDDLSSIQQRWLEYCRTVARSDMRIRRDAEAAMREWLGDRFHHPNSIGLVAEFAGRFAGFLIGRVDDWESVPPLIEPRRIGIIDAVYVIENLRKQGIGARLIGRAIEIIRDARAIAVETTYEAWNEASARAWHSTGFAPWMIHAYRML
jgi:GNAT superfamily N-acetyltransferase